MPYDKTSELPDSVKDNLPKQSAFNSAWDQYDDPEDRRGNDDRESVSHKVAWSAVKDEYTKSDGKWVKKKS